MTGEFQIVHDVGALEILIIVAVILLLYGGRKLPEVARSVARARKAFEEESEERESPEIGAKRAEEDRESQASGQAESDRSEQER